jgi:hypothetical protein
MRRTPRASREDTPNDVGTLWTMQRWGTRARCALMAWPEGWELRVLVDGEPLLEERCARADEAFALADTWKHRMREQGWQQIVPRSASLARPDDRQSA